MLVSLHQSGAASKAVSGRYSSCGRLSDHREAHIWKYVTLMSFLDRNYGSVSTRRDVMKSVKVSLGVTANVANASGVLCGQLLNM